MSKSELVSVAAVGAAGAVVQERLRSQPLLAAAEAGAFVLLSAYAADAPGAAVTVAPVVLVAALASA